RRVKLSRIRNRRSRQFVDENHERSLSLDGSNLRELMMEENVIDEGVFKLDRPDGVDDQRSRAGNFKFQHEPDPARSDALQDVFDTPDPFPVSGIEGPQLPNGYRIDSPPPVGRSPDRRIVKRHQNAVGCPPDVDLDEIHAQPDSRLNRRQGVFRRVARGAAMAYPQYSRHDDSEFSQVGKRSRGTP